MTIKYEVADEDSTRVSALLKAANIGYVADKLPNFERRLNDAPTGSIVTNRVHGTVYTKKDTGLWYAENSTHAWNSGAFAAEFYNLTVAPEKTLAQVKEDQFQRSLEKAPGGSIVRTSYSGYEFEKRSDGLWYTEEGRVGFLSASFSAGQHVLETPCEQTEQQKSERDLKAFRKAMKDAPVGSKVERMERPRRTFIKRDTGRWNEVDECSGHERASGFEACNFDLSYELTVADTSQRCKSAIQRAMDDAPLGSTVKGAFGSIYVKRSDGWHFRGWNDTEHAQAWVSTDFTGDQWILTLSKDLNWRERLDAAPAYSTLRLEPGVTGNTYVKKDDGQWYIKNALGKTEKFAYPSSSFSASWTLTLPDECEKPSWKKRLKDAPHRSTLTSKLSGRVYVKLSDGLWHLRAATPQHGYAWRDFPEQTWELNAC